MSKETLKEASTWMDTEKEQISFIKGAKWQQERSYSEEDILNLLWRLYTTPNYMADFDTKADLIEWFEQFKKHIESKS